jgi:hypothetical protein
MDSGGPNIRSPGSNAGVAALDLKPSLNGWD